MGFARSDKPDAGCPVVGRFISGFSRRRDDGGGTVQDPPARSRLSGLLPVAAVLALLAGCSPSHEDPSESPATAGPGTLSATREPVDPGEAVYARACVACHQNGLVGAPRLGDRAAWAPRIARGTEVLVQHAINGFSGEAGVMPARGGHAYLSDEEVKAAVAWMVAAAR